MALTQYTDRYIYDKGLNLTNIYHNQNAPQVQGVMSNSNRLSEFDYDAAGNQLETENVDDITYNCDGQIALTKKVTGEATVTEYYTYAAPGHRVKKVTKTATSDVVTGIDVVFYVGGNEYRTSYTGTDLFYDGDVVTGNVSATQDNVETRIKSGHGQVAKITQNSQSSSVSYSYHLINNIDSNSVELDDTSGVVSHQSFYPYGGVASTQGSTNNKQLGYSGQELDSTSLNDYGYRYYNSKAGRWTRPDPIGFRSGQLNLYAMVKGGPVSFEDQAGMGFNLGKIFLRLIPALIQAVGMTYCFTFMYSKKTDSAEWDAMDRVMGFMLMAADQVAERWDYGDSAVELRYLKNLTEFGFSVAKFGHKRLDLFAWSLTPLVSVSLEKMMMLMLICWNKPTKNHELIAIENMTLESLKKDYNLKRMKSPNLLDCANCTLRLMKYLHEGEVAESDPLGFRCRSNWLKLNNEYMKFHSSEFKGSVKFKTKVYPVTGSKEARVKFKTETNPVSGSKEAPIVQEFKRGYGSIAKTIENLTEPGNFGILSMDWRWCGGHVVGWIHTREDGIITIDLQRFREKNVFQRISENEDYEAKPWCFKIKSAKLRMIQSSFAPIKKRSQTEVPLTLSVQSKD